MTSNWRSNAALMERTSMTLGRATLCYMVGLAERPEHIGKSCAVLAGALILDGDRDWYVVSSSRLAELFPDHVIVQRKSPMPHTLLPFGACLIPQLKQLSSTPGSRSKPEHPHCGMERTRAAFGKVHSAADPYMPS
jgi:hypothetical protein